MPEFVTAAGVPVQVTFTVAEAQETARRLLETQRHVTQLTGVWTIQGNTRTYYSAEELTATANRTALEEEQRRAKEDDRRRRAAAATERAKETLLRMLTPAQRRSVEDRRHFDVTGSEGNLYRIHTNVGYSGNIQHIASSGISTACFCCHPDMYPTDPVTGSSEAKIPPEDALIAQKLMIETDEVMFLRIAVCQGGRRPDVGFEHVSSLSLYSERKCICVECEERRYQERYF